jgi:hypothetical protein
MSENNDKLIREFKTVYAAAHPTMPLPDIQYENGWFVFHYAGYQIMYSRTKMTVMMADMARKVA